MSASMPTDQLNHLSAELTRTGLTLRKLAQHVIKTDRSLIPAETLNLMLSECPLPDITDHANALIDIVKDLPDAADPIPGARNRFRSKRRIKVSEDMRIDLQKRLKERGVSLAFIEQHLFSASPKGELATTLGKLAAGTQSTIKADVYEKLLAYLSEVAPINDEKGSKQNCAPVSLPVSKHKRAPLISDEYYQTLKPDLEPDKIPEPKIRPRAQNYSLPERSQKLGYVMITDEIFRELHEHRRRTLVSYTRLLKASPDAPADLNPRQLNLWFNGGTLSAERHLLDWVLEAYRSLPTAR